MRFMRVCRINRKILWRVPETEKDVLRYCIILNDPRLGVICLVIEYDQSKASTIQTVHTLNYKLRPKSILPHLCASIIYCTIMISNTSKLNCYCIEITRNFKCKKVKVDQDNFNEYKLIVITLVDISITLYKLP